MVKKNLETKINLRLLKDIIKKSYMYLTNKIIKIKRNKIVFISFGGERYSDNPKAISEKLHKLHPEFEIVWLFNEPKNKEEIVPNYVKCVENTTLKAIKELATSQFWVDNFNKPQYIFKDESQIYIQTWHGDRGFKKILYDKWPDRKSPMPLIESKICNLAVAGSDYGEMKYKSAFQYSGNILKKGCPRNDILVKKTLKKQEIIKNKIKIEKDTKILLYAPTFRESDIINKTKQKNEINLLEVINTLERVTKDRWICFTRVHSGVKGLDGIPNNDKFINVSNYEDMNELLLISDMLITDYSSSAGDYALLNRPIVLFQSDRNKYLEEDREFYFDIEKSPFEIAMNQTELINFIENIKNFDARKNCEEILDFYGTHETGKATNEVINYIFSKYEQINY